MTKQYSCAAEFIEAKINNVRSSRHFKGISRHSSPTWAGWRIIDEAIAQGIRPDDITDAKLEILVNNHWSLEYVKTLFRR